MTNLYFEGSGETTLCLSDGIVSSQDAIPLNVSYGDCIIFSGGILGDVNSDGSVNVLDVVLMVNFILDQGQPSISELAAADVNGDGSLNVLDVVNTVNIILGD